MIFNGTKTIFVKIEGEFSLTTRLFWIFANIFIILLFYYNLFRFWLLKYVEVQITDDNLQVQDCDYFLERAVDTQHQ